MAVQVWIGEKPEHPNERRAIVALANGLERLDGLYLILANFSVGGRTIDLVIIKQDAIFIIELKHCDGKVFGDVNGPWFVESANGVRKRLNPGRKNPYNQVVSYYYSLINFLNERRGDFLSANKASSIDFRTCRRVIVIAPTIQEGSKVDIDWKVDLKGLDELPVYLVTERSSEINLSEDEMLAIPNMLHCTRWKEINTLIAGPMPRWESVPAEVHPAPASVPAPTPAPQPMPAPEPPVAMPTPLAERLRGVLTTWPGRTALALGVLSLVLALLLFARAPAVPLPDQASTSLISTSEIGPAGGLNPPGVAPTSCVWSGFQPVGRRRGAESGSWENVGVFGSAPALSPDVVIFPKEIDFCGDRIAILWSVQNNMSDDDVILPLTSENISVRDEHGDAYAIDDNRSRPAELRVAPGAKGTGTVVIERPASLTASTLRISLKREPFGEAVWLVNVPGS